MPDNPNYKIYTWKHPEMLLWILNPVMAINELILGQRVPKVMWMDTDKTKTLRDRVNVPCPHCGTVHPGAKWSAPLKTTFKNWFGIYCDHCGQIIPCHRNITSLIILGITFPIWFWFKDRWKTTWLKNQPARYAAIDLEHLPDPLDGQGWKIIGLRWGMWMFLIMTILYPLIIGDKIDLIRILVNIPIWFFGGLGFGYMMKLMYGKKTGVTNG